uniref:Trafficking protein particle complex subunit 2-like protein n=3 Tax=Sus scrofa TaxID=9823 RepID=A0A8D1VFL7_PIG
MAGSGQYSRAQRRARAGTGLSTQKVKVSDRLHSNPLSRAVLFLSARPHDAPWQNYPLYIRSVPTENELQFHYMLHTSLDVVDEKISAMGKALVDQRELYLGLLYPTEDYKVYGYVTNSKVKFVMVVDSSNTALRDNEIRSMFRKLHSSYTDVMCNPFYTPGDRIQSRAFDSMVTAMMIQVC